jgi:uncharacterized membrane protein YgcG
MPRQVIVGLAVLIGAAMLSTGGAARVVDMLSISPPADITVTADSVCGAANCAAVSYTFGVTGGSPPYTLVCNFYSGNLFLVGTHVVSCLAQDSVGSSTPEATFTVTVNPGGPPPPPPPPPPPMLAIAAPADISVTADSVCGATSCAAVSFSFGVTGGYPPYTLVCNFYSGNLFLVGTHPVSCLAQDSVGNSTPQASFNVTVTAPVTSPPTGGGGGGGGGGDGGGSGGGGSGSGSGSGSGGGGGGNDTTGPIIDQHPDMKINATSQRGAVVSYAVSATDADNTAFEITLSCVPTSGSTFALGSAGTNKRTIVTCEAHDLIGNKAASKTFGITVLGVHAQVAVLKRRITPTTILTKSSRTSLVSKLVLADRDFAAGSVMREKTELRLFIQQVLQLRTSSQAPAVWIREARRIAAASG